MEMKKLISFRTLKENCFWCSKKWIKDSCWTKCVKQKIDEIHYENCSQKTCPIWKRLKEVKDAK